MATVEVVDHGRFLGSRLKGAQLRVVVESVLASRDRVVLDFAGVESITDSFAHELFGVLSAEHGGTLPDGIEIRNANRNVQDTIEFATEATAA